MISRLLSFQIEKSPKSVLLLGPRQVGKSTLILKLNPDLVINLNDDKTYLDFKSNPSELKERITLTKPKTIFIDEIQRHPSLLNTVQTIIDADQTKKIKFYISGSSARKLKRGQANLLPGRVFSYQLSPPCAAELNYKLNISHALSYGCLPEPYLTKEISFAEKLLTSYSGIYLKEEVQAEALTRNLDGFSRFIMSAAETSGQILDFSKIAKQAKIERKICSRFYEILEDTLIATHIDVFDKTDADITKRPKYYFFDVGVLNGLLENFVASADRKGLLFEHLVYNQLISSARSKDLPIKVTYFRTKNGYKVDFVVQVKNKTYAVEVKSGVIQQDDAKKLENFKKYYPKCDGLFIVGLKNDLRKIDSVVICDLNYLLKSIGL